MRWLRAIGRAFYDASGRPLRFDGVSVDITRQKEAEETLIIAAGLVVLIIFGGKKLRSVVDDDAAAAVREAG